MIIIIMAKRINVFIRGVGVLRINIKSQTHSSFLLLKRHNSGPFISAVPFGRIGVGNIMRKQLDIKQYGRK